MQDITDAERVQICTLRSTCAKELEAASRYAELVHDYSLARFLRGHPAGVEAAATALSASLTYRTELRANEAHSALWAACAKADEIDVTILPHAETMLKFLPFRTLQGGSVFSTPVGCALSKFLDLPGFDAVDGTIVGEFIACYVEQRAILLHKLSVRDGRMVKFIEMRDLTNMSVAGILKNASALKKLATAMSRVGSFYPEVMHIALAVNTPPAFSQLFAVISPFLNPRTREKIRQFPLGSSLLKAGEVLSARAVWSWGQHASSHLDFSRPIQVPRGGQEWAVRWVEAGETVRVHAKVIAGAPVLRRAFKPAAGDGAPFEEEHSLSVDEEHSSAFGPAEHAGVLHVNVDNSGAWWNDVTVELRSEITD